MIVRRQLDDHCVVDVGPLGMVVHGFGLECNASHEAEGFVEIVETESSGNMQVSQRPLRGNASKGSLKILTSKTDD